MFISNFGEKLFGDRSSFAILYRPYENSLFNQSHAYCHFILGEKFIGSPDEICLLGTWALLVDSFKKHLETNRTKLSNKLFNCLSDIEIFELVLKSNQLEDEFNSAFHYLPIQEELWGLHSVRLDETQDAYLIVVIEEGEQLKFIWRGWRQPCPLDEIDKLFSIKVDFNIICSVIDECLDFLNKNYPEISIGVK